MLKRFHYKSSYRNNVNRLTLRVFNIFSLLAIVTMFSKYKKKAGKKRRKKANGIEGTYVHVQTECKSTSG